MKRNKNRLTVMSLSAYRTLCFTDTAIMANHVRALNPHGMLYACYCGLCQQNLVFQTVAGKNI